MYILGTLLELPHWGDVNVYLQFNFLWQLYRQEVAVSIFYCLGSFKPITLKILSAKG